MAESKKVKLGYGDYENIDTAITEGKIDERDIVITKDTSEFVYIRDDKTKQVIKARIARFENEQEAVAQLNTATDTYAGQPVAIKGSNGKYQSYTVQDGESGFVVESIADSAGSNDGLTWVEF